jgi:predicted RNA-binding Zn ribbon-like protein
MADPEASSGRKNLALELANTRRQPGAPAVDLLRTPADLVGWLEGAGLLAEPSAEALRSPSARRSLLSEAHGLRLEVEALLDAFKERADFPSAALFGLNRILAAGCTSMHLEATAAGLRVLERARGDGLLGILVPVAQDAARLLTTGDPSRLRRCASPDCHLWFIDTSKSGRRRWCSMSRCGNRAKVARHRRRAAGP